MEFHINTTHATVDQKLVQEMLWQIDPASVSQLAADGRELLVSVDADASRLLAALQGISLPVDESDITQVASVCCGGCGG